MNIAIKQINQLFKIGELVFSTPLPVCFQKAICGTCDFYTNGCIFMVGIQNYLKPLTCEHCGREGAIMFNPYNGVINCHHCGANWSYDVKIMLN